MTIAGNGQPKVHKVQMSRQTKALVRKLHWRAAESGKGQQFVAAFRTIINRLQADPLNLGEPLYRLPGLQLLVCQAVVGLLLVDFAVHETLPLVFIRGFKVLS